MPPRKRERASARTRSSARSEQSQGRAAGSRSKGGPGKACAASAASASLSATAAQEESDDDAAAATARPQETGTALSCVLKVYCTSVRPNFAQPWQMKRQQESTSSGFILRDEQIFPARGIIILTNAHSVAHSVTVRVRKHGSPVKHVAKVLHIGHECDVAVLVVEDPAFYDDLPEPLQLGHTARLQDPVTVVGYPTGGDNLSVTVGVVSRVDVQAYSHSSERFLTLQIDAAINAGRWRNSGGPALKAGRCVGIAFETLDDAENIGYLIPAAVVARFLDDLRSHGEYTRWCSLGFSWQPVESPALRSHLKLGEGRSGVYVGEVYPTGAASGVLREGDVVLRLGGQPIADDGTVPFEPAAEVRGGASCRSQRVSFDALLLRHFVGDSIAAHVLRGGAERQVRLPLGCHHPLVPLHLHEERPSYVVCGGAVFTALSQPYLQHEWGKAWERRAPPLRLARKVVLLSQLLGHECVRGYDSALLANSMVRALNGVPILCLAQLAQLVRACRQRSLRFDLEESRVLVLDTAQARGAEAEILQQHNIPEPVLINERDAALLR
ncbi:hypothetical protein EMIHUDRAFT_430070 [Emiliania huxleyi CCMP1516]|uniref:PDZ domain-containing protein n=2 Tax=Emiliania huxleyi TaxID=2903 RepID=A0A0D3JV97_EMIH1|nr:hypothetical protein EMIHUDRAFT_430070 [Emiliania huxleyi CCMP1516]EOD27432.1 hypothetical protein EMIHUDRAFT_430070 [Emiliania huxleyi CCMP1516]|eukprot:XP_005779861.1 hypothetical protein EMIHUDRAFT_430070 [Emiliania huxleyi CCMP1516]